jgi:hypothetical protein
VRCKDRCDGLQGACFELRLPQAMPASAQV